MTNIIHLKDRKRNHDLDLSKFGDVREPNPKDDWIDHLIFAVVIGGGTIGIWALILWSVMR